MRPGILTLTTDFGTSGPYVAAMKGVVLGLAPGAQLVDVCHTIAPQNILEGAFILAGVVDAFPDGTVHLGVVDPGVGSDRRLIAAALKGHWFVLPDNGLLSGVARDQAPDGIWEITNPKIRRAVVSATFHGRDILAPAAAHLLIGGDPAELGPARTKFVALRNFKLIEDERGFVAEVIFRDAFGNLVTNIPAAKIDSAAPESWLFAVASENIEGLTRCYSDRPTGSLVALVGGTGWVEIAVVNGDAAQRLSAGPGSTVWVRRRT
jgi:S-adenosylmethionine hydrolase